MPIYEYNCQDCGHDFEALVRNGEKPEECPKCGRARLSKKWSVPAAHSSQSAPAGCPADAPSSCGLPGCCGGQCDLG
jgi:putative FmdB family regulatory protein